ncbi:MAG: putative HAD superfamily phosphohydrolase YqeG [Candidatus Krumholzibacteriia bacterium]|jgi:predicted HAD superfamily phosphohydrolase YqeG
MAANTEKFILWDMAGTLITFDPETTKQCALPGCVDFLPELARHFRLLCTTGDRTSSARALLDSFDILPHLEAIYGGLNQPVGKPYGDILRQLDGSPAHSIAVGDRLLTDIGSDTDQVVSILINQGSQLNSAGMVSYMIHVLNRQSADDYPTAFRHLTINAAIDESAIGSAAGGRITAAWQRHDGFDYRLWVFEHDDLDGERLVIVLGNGS